MPFQREIQSRKERAAAWTHKRSALGRNHPHRAPFAPQLPFPCLATPPFSAWTAAVGCEVVLHLEGRATSASDRPLFCSSGTNCAVCVALLHGSFRNVLTTEKHFLRKKNNHIYGKTRIQEVFRLKHRSSPLGQHRRREEQNTNKQNTNKQNTKRGSSWSLPHREEGAVSGKAKPEVPPLPLQRAVPEKTGFPGWTLVSTYRVLSVGTEAPSFRGD